MEFSRRKNGPITLSGYQRSSANPNQPTNEMTMKKNESSDDLRLPDEERLERIAQAFDAQRRQLNFVHSNLFFAAGWISLLTLTAQFMLDTLLGAAWLWYLLWLPAGIAGVALLLIRRDKHRTVTLTDRSLLNVWLFAIGVTGYTAFYLDGRLPIAGFLTIGMAIAVAFTSELFRRNGPNKSNQGGSLVVLQMASVAGAFLAAWIFRAALDGQTLMQFLLTFAAVALQLLGTGVVLRYHERRKHV